MRSASIDRCARWQPLGVAGTPNQPLEPGTLMTLLSLVLVLATSQIVPCGPREFSDACKCKQGMATACEALRQTDRKLADALEEAASQALKKVPEASQTQEAEESDAQVQGASDAPEPPECKGQRHHIISRTIARALRNHPTLRGLYTARDPRFVTQAKDEESHCGYQQWHRDVDREVTQWLLTNKTATPKQFEAFLRERYSRPDLRLRFPHGF